MIVPTNDFVERMMEANMLQELDHSLIPNIANIEPAFQDASFDPRRGKFSLPYMWGTIGIGYRTTEVDERAGQLEMRCSIPMLSTPGAWRCSPSRPRSLAWR